MDQPIYFDFGEMDFAKSINCNIGTINLASSIDPSNAMFDVPIRYMRPVVVCSKYPTEFFRDENNVLVNRSYANKVRGLKKFRLCSNPEQFRKNLKDVKLRAEIQALCLLIGFGIDKITDKLIDIIILNNDWLIYTCDNEQPTVTHMHAFNLFRAEPEQFTPLTKQELDLELISLDKNSNDIGEMIDIIMDQILWNNGTDISPITNKNILAMPITCKSAHFKICDRFSKSKTYTSLFPSYDSEKDDLERIIGSMKCLKFDPNFTNFEHKNSPIPKMVVWLSILDQILSFLHTAYNKLRNIINQLSSEDAILGGSLSEKINNIISLGFDDSRTNISRDNMDHGYNGENFMFIGCSTTAYLSNPEFASFKSKFASSTVPAFYKSHNSGVIICQGSNGNKWNIFAEVKRNPQTKTTLGIIETELYNIKTIRDAKA
jgi:hypothetical protein